MTDLHRIGAVAATILVFSVQPGGARDVIFVPTPPEVVQRMLELAEVGTGDRVLDLGSGDGRIVIAAVKDFGAERAVGVDIDPDRIAESQENARKAGVEDRVEFRQEDLFETDLSNADVITMYLLQSINERLKPRLLAEAQPGTRVVSHDFHMGSDWPPSTPRSSPARGSTAGPSRPASRGNGRSRFDTPRACASTFSTCIRTSSRSRPWPGRGGRRHRQGGPDRRRPTQLRPRERSGR